jgi:hypothetical protein
MFKFAAGASCGSVGLGSTAAVIGLAFATILTASGAVLVL